MARSIKQQLTYAVRQNSAFGQSKHAEKCKGLGMDSPAHDGRIYSNTSFGSRLDLAKQFGTWMQNNHSEISMAKDIRASHFNEFLKTKSERCTKDTLVSYASNLRALAKEVQNTYGCNPLCERLEIKTPDTKNESIRTVAMTDNDIKRLKTSFKTFSTGYRGICIAQAVGARVEGIIKLTANDIKIYSQNKAEVFIHGEKGGRDRTVFVNDTERIKELQDIKKQIPGNQRICPVREDSLNKSFRRHMKELGMDKKYELTTTHAMRKNWAQNRYNEYRKDHTKLETVQYVNSILGHGKERDEELLARYVENIH